MFHSDEIHEPAFCFAWTANCKNRSSTCTHSRTQFITQALFLSLSLSLTLSVSQTHARATTHVRTHARTPPPTRHTHTHTHTHARTRTHTHTRARAHTTHTPHTHTHTLARTRIAAAKSWGAEGTSNRQPVTECRRYILMTSARLLPQSNVTRPLLT